MSKDLLDDESRILMDIREGLRKQFRLRGRGSQKRTLERVGMAKSSLDMAFSRGSLKVTSLLQILKELDIDPGAFFQNVIPPGKENTLRETEPPHAVKVGLERMRRAKDDQSS